MSRFNIAAARARFSELVRRAMLGEEIIIARDNKPVLMLVLLNKPRGPRMPGSGKGQLLYIAPDFDGTPKDFKDYV
jgi:antitoxin (DNA-binding transcriptional repressor) of toxin-antitoxin stability system